jgi:hypothetical protein
MVYSPSGHRESLNLPPSGWIDIPATGEARGHWIPAEGEQARNMLTALRSRYSVDAKQIFVVSPFRDVADGIERLLREFPGVLGGTVHAVQGKEADVVLFILGGNPGQPTREALGRRASQPGERRGQPRTPPSLRHRRPHRMVQVPLLRHLVQLLGVGA